MDHLWTCMASQQQGAVVANRFPRLGVYARAAWWLELDEPALSGENFGYVLYVVKAGREPPGHPLQSPAALLFHSRAPTRPAPSACPGCSASVCQVTVEPLLIFNDRPVHGVGQAAFQRAPGARTP